MQIGPVQVEDKTVLIVGGVAVVLIIGGAWYAARKVKETAEDVGEYIANDAVNVYSSKNIAAGTINAVGAATGLFGTNDYTGKANTLGSGIEELSRPFRAWAGWL